MSKFLDIFEGRHLVSPPIWFMRQAGRSLPEYREVRRACGNFLDLCYTPELAAKVTLQPAQRFDLDAAILFSDILVIPHGLGQSLSFEEGRGPLLPPLSLSFFEETLSFESFLKTLAPVYEAIKRVKAQAPDLPLIGFAGAPWTLALYMLEGQGSRDFSVGKIQAFQQEEKFESLMALLVEAISLHLIEQVRAGVNALQLFDTWAGLCPATHFSQWILKPHQAILKNLRNAFPTLPLISFPKGIGANLPSYGRHLSLPEICLSGLSLDASLPLPWAVNELPSSLILQGNLDPLLLVAGGDSLKKAIETIRHHMGQRPYIFNLGHGILPQTPLHHIEECIHWVRREI